MKTMKWTIILFTFALALICMHARPSAADLYLKLAQPQYDGEGALYSYNQGKCGTFSVVVDLRPSPGFVEITATAPSASAISISVSGKKTVCAAALECKAKLPNASFAAGTPKTPKGTIITATMVDANKCTLKLAPTIYRSEIGP